MFSARQADRDRSDIPLRANPDDLTDRSVHRDPERQLVQNDGSCPSLGQASSMSTPCMTASAARLVR